MTETLANPVTRYRGEGLAPQEQDQPGLLSLSVRAPDLGEDC